MGRGEPLVGRGRRVADDDMEEGLALYARRFGAAQHADEMGRHPAALHALRRVDRGIQAGETVECEAFGLGPGPDAVGDLGDDAVHAARADEQPGEVRAVGVAFHR